MKGITENGWAKMVGFSMYQLKRLRLFPKILSQESRWKREKRKGFFCKEIEILPGCLYNEGR